MTEFTGRRHRLNIPSSSGSDDPAVLKKEMSTMRQLMMDEFNRMADDFYQFKRTTFEAGIIPLKQVNNLAVTYDEYSVSAVWENPQQDDLVPTHVRVRILEITPNEWAEYTYPKDSWEFNGLEAGTQYTLQVQLIGRYEATDTFVSTTRNCPSVPVLRMAESAIKAKVFTTDDGVGPPTDPGLTDPEIEFPFPTPPGNPAVVGPTGCHWEYQFQESSGEPPTWADIGSATTFSGLVSSVVVDTSAAPFDTAGEGPFRMKYRSICDNVAGGWVYTPSFLLQDTDLCGEITASASLSTDPYDTADWFAVPVPCHPIGEWLHIKDNVSGNVVTTHGPNYIGLSRVNDEWTVFGADTSALSPGYGQMLTAALPLTAALIDTSDFSFSIDVWMKASYGSTVAGLTYPVMRLGNKISVTVNFFDTTYSLTVTVPRDGGGAYRFRADNCAYETWNTLAYVHDVSEPDGRNLYLNTVNVDTSSNAIENDFDGIDDSFHVYGFPLSRVRKMYGWLSALTILPDVPGVGGYCFGGYNSGGAAQTSIYKLTFASEASSTLAATCTAQKAEAGVSDSGVAGYASAGTAIDKLTFPTEVQSVLTATLGGSNTFRAAMNNMSVAGYWLHDVAASSAIDKLLFSTEATSTLSATLTNARDQSTSWENGSVGGYSAGAVNNNTTDVDKLAYATETVSALTALATGRRLGVGISYAGTAGYLVSGIAPSADTVIQKWAYPSDTRSTLAATIPTAGVRSCGVESQWSGGGGYLMGGGSPASTAIQKLLFSTETTSTLAATIAASRSYGAGVSDAG
jgi:hypothetical protein